jgi:hypothetical protein
MFGIIEWERKINEKRSGVLLLNLTLIDELITSDIPGLTSTMFIDQVLAATCAFVCLKDACILLLSQWKKKTN